MAPFTDEFLEDYCGFQDDERRMHTVSGLTTTHNGYDPIKTTDGRFPVAYLFLDPSPSAGANPNTKLQAFFENGRVNLDIGRVQLDYSESFSPWDGTSSTITIDFSSFNVTNNTATDVTFSGIEIVDSVLDASGGILPASALLTQFILTRDGTTGTLPRYTCTEAFFFNRWHRVYASTGPSKDHVHQVSITDAQEFVPDSELPDTSTDTDTITVFQGGRYSICRYNYPETYTLQPTDSINIDPGTISLVFDTTAITCT